MAARRILFLHYGEYSSRGSEKVLLDILSGLDKTIFEIVLVCNVASLAAEAEALGVRTYIISWPEVMVDSGYVRLQFIKLLSTVNRLRKIIRDESADLVVSNCGLANQAGLYAARLSGVPVVAYVHAPYTKRYIYLYGLNRTNKTIFVSNAIRDSAIAKVSFASEMVIHNGIDVDKFCPPKTRNRDIVDDLVLDRNKIIIGQVGSLIKRKGIDLLIEAGKLLADKGLDFHLLLVGSGSDEAEFRRLVQRLDLSGYVTFYGNTDVPQHFYQNIFDINVLASRSEAFGLSLAEGSACGLPCVGSNAEGIPEVMRDGETGYQFAVGDVSELAGKLEQLIVNPSLREDMGANGRKYIVKNLSLQKQIDSLSQVLTNIISDSLT